MACESCPRPEGTICPARAFIGQFDRNPIQRMRVQVAALELARHDLDQNGHPLPLTEEQKERKPDAETVLAFADAFRPVWNQGEKCPEEIAKKVVARIQGLRIE